VHARRRTGILLLLLLLYRRYNIGGGGVHRDRRIILYYIVYERFKYAFNEHHRTSGSYVIIITFRSMVIKIYDIRFVSTGFFFLRTLSTPFFFGPFRSIRRDSITAYTQ
jgi:hypothetical protein